MMLGLYGVFHRPPWRSEASGKWKCAPHQMLYNLAAEAGLMPGLAQGLESLLPS